MCLKIHSGENLFYGKQENWDENRWHQIKIRERKGPSRGIIQMWELHERNPCAPRFEDRTQEETLREEECACKAACTERTQDETWHQERCARRVAWDVAKKVSVSSKVRIKLLFTFLLKPGQCQRPLQKLQRNENSWSMQAHQYQCTS